ncbi:MAG: hypothetical protein ACFFCD_01515 [Promethearchaeota archaeon]
MSMQQKQHNYRFVFKIVVIGPNEYLNDKVLRLISHSNIMVDGIGVHIGRVTSESVKISYWNPHQNAIEVLVGLSYQGAKGALIVSPKEDTEAAVRYRTEIKKKCGNIPTSILLIDKNKTFEAIRKITDLMIRELVVRIRKSLRKKSKSGMHFDLKLSYNENS